LDIERRFGRERRLRWGRRTLDLDLIACGDTVVSEPGLTLPHPEAARRAFVLVPLCEVAPDWPFPDGRTARQLLAELDPQALAGVRRVGQTGAGAGGQTPRHNPRCNGGPSVNVVLLSPHFPP